MKNPSRRKRFFRWGLLAVPIVLGMVLITSSVHNHLSAKKLVDELTRGQAQGFARDVRDASDPSQGPPRQEDLALVLKSRRSSGLRFIAMLDAGGQLVHEAGQPAVQPGHSLPMPGELQHVGGRVRWLMPPAPLPPGIGPIHSAGFSGRPPHPPPHHVSPGRGGPPRPPGREGLGPPPGHAILIEFEPTSALALVERSERNVALNVIAALVLMAAATVLWRLYARAQEVEADLARQKHLAVLGEMSAVLAHEIRNPLTTVKGHAQLIAERVSDDELQSKWANLMVDHVLRLERLTNQLLDFSRTREVRRKTVSIATLLDEAGYELDHDRILLETDDAPKTWSLDPERMNQVFVNVMRNALQASPQDQQIDVTAVAEGDELIVSVRDRGDGIPAGAEQRIFEPFHTKRIRGTGLGLTVAKRIVELHGGHIEASNHPDGGAVFHIALPKG